jgi:hypothetical protein
MSEVISSVVRLACRTLLLFLVGSSCAYAQATPAPANGDTYPNRTIRYVVPYPPGAFNDTMGRIFAQKLSEAWGVPVVVENWPSGGTLIGTDSVGSVDDGLETLMRLPAVKEAAREAHWYHLWRQPPKYTFPEKDDWSVAGELSLGGHAGLF